MTKFHGSAPYLGGGFGHFYSYAPEKFEYPINRFSMEAKRQLDVLDRNLAERQFLTGDRYSIADIAASIFGLFYLGFLPSHWLSLRGLDNGLEITLSACLMIVSAFFLTLPDDCMWLA